MERLRIKDFICSKCINDFRILDRYKDKSDIEIIIELYMNKAIQHCKENNVEINEFSIRKDESEKYYIEIYFD